MHCYGVESAPASAANGTSVRFCPLEAPPGGASGDAAGARMAHVRWAVCPHAPVAQLDRASVYGTEGREFESLRARLKTPGNSGVLSFLEDRRGGAAGQSRGNLSRFGGQNERPREVQPGGCLHGPVLPRGMK